jgi:hypothetical protein
VSYCVLKMVFVCVFRTLLCVGGFDATHNPKTNTHTRTHTLTR